MWGGAINDIFAITPVDKLPYFSTSFCALSISGSSLMSWSIVIDCGMQQLDIEEKLQIFKKQVRLQSSSMAFLILPSNKDNLDRSRLDIFRNIFPTITLISIFNDKSNVILSLDSTNVGMFFEAEFRINTTSIKRIIYNDFEFPMFTEYNPQLKHSNSYAYVILTYKKQI